MAKLRVLYIVAFFPQLSQTYIRTEIEAIRNEFDVFVVTRRLAETPHATDLPYEQTKDIGRILEIVAEFKPDVLHTHYIHLTGLLHQIAEETGIPFTVRCHSFDVLGKGKKYGFIDSIGRRLTGRPDRKPSRPETYGPFVNSDYCLGALAFPFARPILVKAGVQKDKIIETFPVVDVKKFMDRSPNGNGVMNVGAALQKKNMAQFIDLAAYFTDRPFRLYAIGYWTDELAEYNRQKGNPAEVVPPVQPDEMPAEYKKHQWLVYTGDRIQNTSGWPMAVAEAQAAGVGVCLANLRPDLREFVGDAGYLYDSIDDVREIIANPPSDEFRERGFEQAKKSDIDSHIHLLTDLWKPLAH